jgi:hypothetical protein
VSQLDLEFRIVRKYARAPRVDREASLQERFETFHAANPHVLENMRALAIGKLRAGVTRIGAKALWEQLREYLRINKFGNYKLDNSLTALYARKLVEIEPVLAPVIELRRRKRA